MKNNTEFIRDFEKTLKVINSCIHYEQIRCARRMFNNWNKLHDGYSSHVTYYFHLKNVLEIKEIGLLHELKNKLNDKQF